MTSQLLVSTLLYPCGPFVLQHCPVELSNAEGKRESPIHLGWPPQTLPDRIPGYLLPVINRLH
jgi:hypothetical protein